MVHLIGRQESATCYTTGTRYLTKTSIDTRKEKVMNTTLVSSEFKPIEVWSVKLPVMSEQLLKKTKGKYLTSCYIKVNGIKDAGTSTLKLGSPISQHALNGNFELKERNPWYRTDQLLYHPPFNLPSMVKSIETQMRNSGFKTVRIKFHQLTFLIKKNVYVFRYHKASRSNTLVSINGEGIGKMTLARRDKLYSGDLKFCLPSHCKIEWTKSKKEICEEE